MKSRSAQLSFLFTLLLLISSCGFRPCMGPLATHYSTMTIPYVKGDSEGRITEALVRSVSRSGAFRYHQSRGELSLLVEVVKIHDDRIGYRYDIDKDEHMTERLVPSEGRLTAIAEVMVVETTTGKTVLGPDQVMARVDYDHDYYTTPSRIPGFSLGQLDDIDVAKDIAFRPLADALAKRVVEHLTNAW